VEYTKQYPKRFTFLKGVTDAILPTLKPEYDFIFIDGDHAYEGCKQDILNCQKLLAPGGVILLDDYGVNIISAVNVDGNGNPIDDYFGVKEATDECFAKGWKRVYTDINFGNGGVAYAKAESG
jgi:predicted O-methyltransferase YrrM